MKINKSVLGRYLLKLMFLYKVCLSSLGAGFNSGLTFLRFGGVGGRICPITN